MRFKTWGLTAAMLSVALLSGCGGGSKSSSDVEIRLVNASAGYSSLDLSVNSVAVNTGVAYGSAGSYGTVSTNASTSQVLSGGTTLASTAPTLSSSYKYSLIAYGWPGAIKTTLLQEGEVAPAAGSSKLLVLNLAPDAGSLDVYLTSSTASLDDATPIASGAGYSTLTAGTYRVRITGVNNKADLRLDLPAVTLDSTQVASLLITPTAGGALVNAISVVQTGAVASYAGSNARVRFIAAFAGGNTVTAMRGGVNLLNSPYAPQIGEYNAVPAGNSALAATVNGAALATLTPQFNAGGDYTVLAWGSASAPQISVLSDDNRLPTSAGTAKIRLINGVANLNANVTMSLDYSAIATNVNPGTASAFSTVPASTASSLSVSSPNSSTPIFSVPTLAVASSGVYYVYLMGDSTSPVGTVGSLSKLR